MDKKEFLGASLHTGLKVLHFDANRESEHICKIEILHNEEVTISDGEHEYDLLLDDLTPILRPLSAMTKPITHNGKTFVPLVELAKIADMNVTDDFKCVEHHNAWGVRFKDEDDECVFYEILSYSSNTNSFSTQTIQGEDVISERVLEMTFNQLQLFQKLIEWHFNLMDESEPFIPVTEEFNPYK